jgi:pimeloyl-ACP methyl ester carboxylesterase
MNDLVYLIHGFNVKDGGEGTTDSIRPHLEKRGLRVREIDYGHFFLGKVRSCNAGIARAITGIIKPGSTCIAHSNGCAITYLACKFGAQFDNVVLVNPALDSKLALAEQVKNIHVWYSPNDPWVSLARYIPWSIWGAQGKTGYTGPLDPRYTQFNLDLILEDTYGHHSKLWHSYENRENCAEETLKMIN